MNCFSHLFLSLRIILPFWSAFRIEGASFAFLFLVAFTAELVWLCKLINCCTRIEWCCQESGIRRKSKHSWCKCVCVSYLLWHMRCSILWLVPRHCSCRELINFRRVFRYANTGGLSLYRLCSILYVLKLVFPVCVLVYYLCRITNISPLGIHQSRTSIFVVLMCTLCSIIDLSAHVKQYL